MVLPIALIAIYSMMQATSVIRNWTAAEQKLNADEFFVVLIDSDVWSNMLIVM